MMFKVVNQCQHKQPCDPPPEAEPETKWRSTQTFEAVPPPRWTRTLLEKFIVDLCRQAGITDLTLVEFRGGPEPGLVTVNGNGHALSMALTFIPDTILGPWLLSHREDGNIWSPVYRPQPREMRTARCCRRSCLGVPDERADTEPGAADLRLVPDGAGAGDAAGDVWHLPAVLRAARAGRETA